MELGSALMVLLRRWLIVLVGGVLTLATAGYVYSSAEPSYRASANLLLLLPRDANDSETATSPFLYLPNELNVLASVVAAAAPSRDFVDRLASQGLTSPYEVGVDPANPIITVGVEGPDPDNVLATRDGLVGALETELAEEQRAADVPDRQTARILVYAAEDTPTQLGGSAVRGVLAVIAVGGLLTLLAAFVVDRLRAARRGRPAPQKNSLPRSAPQKNSLPRSAPRSKSRPRPRP